MRERESFESEREREFRGEREIFVKKMFLLRRVSPMFSILVF